MNVLLHLANLMKQIPIWVWAIVLICIFVPTLWYAVKRSAKLLFIVICVAAILFIFPSITTSFMNRAGLTYDEETGILTNRDGQTIQLSIPSGDVTSISEQNLSVAVKQLEDAGVTIEELMGSGGTAENLGQYMIELLENPNTVEDSETLKVLINYISKNSEGGADTQELKDAIQNAINYYNTIKK